MKEFYTCKRMRLLSYLKEKGFEVEAVVPDVNNPKMNCWLFRWTPELNEVLSKYFGRE